MKDIVVLSLFDGMSCCQIALKELGINIDTYYSSEVEKYPIQVTQHNFPNTIQLGDVRDVDVFKLKPIKLLLGGSPCQSFSFAGKRKGMATKCDVEIYTLEKYLELKNEGFDFEGQSYLFWEYIRILTDIRKYNPDVKFMLENVEMGKKWERVLSEAIGVYGVHINSALVSAQNRKRIYWTNIRTRKEGLFGDLYSDIPQPKDEGILLKDILESDVDEKYYLSEKAMSKINCDVKEEGFYEISEQGKKIGKQMNKSHSLLQIDYKGFGNQEMTGYVKIDKKGNVKENQEKASCFTAGGHSGGNHSDMDLIVHNLLPRSSKSGKGGTGPLSRNDGKTYCVSTNDTNAIETREVIQLNPSKESGGNQPYQHNNRVYDTNGISPCLDTDSGRKSIYSNNRIRRLTPLEVQRLQTIPSWYDMSILSDTQIYKACGNGWTIKVITHILSFLNK